MGDLEHVIVDSAIGRLKGLCPRDLNQLCRFRKAAEVSDLVDSQAHGLKSIMRLQASCKSHFRPNFPARLVASRPPLSAYFQKKACDLTPTWSHLRRAAHPLPPRIEQRSRRPPVLSQMARSQALLTPPIWSHLHPASLVAARRPFGRLSPPAWSTITARFVVFQTVNLLESHRNSSRKLNLFMKLNLRRWETNRCLIGE